MSYVLGKPIVAGRYTVTVVSRQGVDGRAIGRRGVALRCTKTPVYVIVSDGQGRVVLDMAGAPVPLEHVSALCPAVM